MASPVDEAGGAGATGTGSGVELIFDLRTKKEMRAVYPPKMAPAT